MKITATTYKGISFIKLSDLPKDQCRAINSWLESSMVINIQIDGDILTDCVQYSDYDHWYDSVYPKIELEKQTKVPTKKSIFGFAVNNQ